MTANELSTALLHILLGGFLGAVLGWTLHHTRSCPRPDPKPWVPAAPTPPHLVLLRDDARPAVREWHRPRLRRVA